MSEKYALGIDTSNYRTSVAVVSSTGEILCSLHRYLDIKKGERGLRQSYALFQHINGLPDLIKEAFGTCGGENIGCVSASARPRPLAGSYMPVFNAGLSAGKMIAAALDVPFYTFSHQEGHIEAVRFYSPLKESERFVAFHFSGGTTEALLVTEGGLEPVGGTLDLAFGQVIDRTGVALGMAFPAGDQMDRLAMGFVPERENLLTRIKVKGARMNLSGIDTQCRRLAGKLADQELIYMLFERLGEAVCDMCAELEKICGAEDFLFAGGVSSSRFIRHMLKEKLGGCRLFFGDPALSGDNAVGTALLGGKNIWR